MSDDLVSLFGLHVTESTVLTIAGDPVTTGAPIYRAHRQAQDPSAWEPFAAVGDIWSFELEPGDYIFKLAEADSDGPITITAEQDLLVVTIPAVQDPVVPPTDVITGTIVAERDQIVTGNPKDPWPPPPPPPPATLTTAERTWFKEILLELEKSVARAPRGDADELFGRPRRAG